MSEATKLVVGLLAKTVGYRNSDSTKISSLEELTTFIGDCHAELERRAAKEDKKREKAGPDGSRDHCTDVEASKRRKIRYSKTW